MRTPSLPSHPLAKPGTNHNPQKPLPAELSITPITASTLPAYRRLITLLLPIRYPDKFYEDSIANPTPSSLALCALWHETPRPGKRKLESLNDEMPSSTPATTEPEAKVIGGIQCRLEPLPCPPSTIPTCLISPLPQQQPHNLYIQTLAILSPYRSLGIATAILDAIISTTLTYYPCQNINVKEIYAHVWEANEEALEWYIKRGFEVEGEMVEGYYTKLRPSGARIVRRVVGVVDWVDAGGGWERKREESRDGVEREAEREVIGKARDGGG
ncbi:MAG: hypothetical protein ALECFALPRED_007695 [Alectoria fallacina]|uniref:N-acetyltransferase domain-containing protein n=1 Tax=Alectoria fallacina TaxID=1903189 RepID=A0A8H3J0J5_9LECA|nr:MAG: hypothetical protein ALECFALPRED_007695 [Alectoria fallacina]